MDKVAEKDVNDAEAKFLEHIQSQHGGILEAIRRDGQLTADTENKMKEVTAAFVEQYVASRA